MLWLCWTGCYDYLFFFKAAINCSIVSLTKLIFHGLSAAAFIIVVFMFSHMTVLGCSLNTLQAKVNLQKQSAMNRIYLSSDCFKLIAKATLRFDARDGAAIGWGGIYNFSIFSLILHHTLASVINYFNFVLVGWGNLGCGFWRILYLF